MIKINLYFTKLLQFQFSLSFYAMSLISNMPTLTWYSDNIVNVC